MRKSLLILTLFALLGLASGLAAYMWWQLGDVEIGLHGYLALGLGVVLSLGLGMGLMGLVFFSHRRGYDDEQYRGRD